MGKKGRWNKQGPNGVLNIVANPGSGVAHQPYGVRRPVRPAAKPRIQMGPPLHFKLHAPVDIRRLRSRLSPLICNPDNLENLQRPGSEVQLIPSHGFSEVVPMLRSVGALTAA
jgi:hypothetical protein